MTGVQTCALPISLSPVGLQIAEFRFDIEYRGYRNHVRRCDTSVVQESTADCRAVASRSLSRRGEHQEVGKLPRVPLVRIPSERSEVLRGVCDTASALRVRRQCPRTDVGTRVSAVMRFAHKSLGRTLRGLCVWILAGLPCVRGECLLGGVLPGRSGNRVEEQL